MDILDFPIGDLIDWFEEIWLLFYFDGIVLHGLDIFLHGCYFLFQEG